MWPDWPIFWKALATISITKMSPIFGKFWCYFWKWDSLCKKYWCNILATFETIVILIVLSHWFVSEFETHHCLDNAEGASQQDDDADDVVDVDDVRARASCTAQNHILCCNAISHRRATAKNRSRFVLKSIQEGPVHTCLGGISHIGEIG